MEKHWIDNLRRRFANRRTAPPAGLWDGVEAALARRRRVRIVSLWVRRAAAVAACVAVVVGAGWWFAGTGDRYGDVTPRSPWRAAVSGRVADAAADAPAGGDVCHDMISRVAAVVYGGGEERDVAEPVDTAFVASADTISSTSDTDGNTTPSLAVDHDEILGGKSSSRRSGYGGKTDALLAMADVGGRRGSGVAVSVYGTGLSFFGNGDGGSNPPMTPFYVKQDAAIGQDVRLLSMSYANVVDASEVNVKHRQPVRVGASVRFRLADRWGLETGVNYSYHSSDIASGDEESGYKTEQKLHFVGVPVNVSYNVWRNDYISVYVSAGGAVDFCVSGDAHTEFVSDRTIVRTDDEDVRDSRPQWSVNASAGVQYDFFPSLGVYLEPGVSYYFNNGSSVKTIFKDKPVNFNLNVGLRFTFNNKEE